MKRAALFDMDRTLLRVNTAPKYIFWRYGRKEAVWVDLIKYLFWTAQYKLGVADAEKVSRKALLPLTGIKELKFREELLQWYQSDVRTYICEDGRKEVQKMREQGYVLGILSASTPYVVGPLAKELGIEHIICTSLEVNHGVLTGRPVEPLCYGEGKIVLAERWATEHDIDLDNSVFYTDSLSDVPMLERVADPRVINPDLRLRILAKKKGWPVAMWT